MLSANLCKVAPQRKSEREQVRGLLGVYSRCGLHTRAVTKLVTVIRRLETFRLLHACSGCFQLERSPGGACTRWKTPPCHGARGKRTSDDIRLDGEGHYGRSF